MQESAFIGFLLRRSETGLDEVRRDDRGFVALGRPSETSVGTCFLVRSRGFSARLKFVLRALRRKALLWPLFWSIVLLAINQHVDCRDKEHRHND